jgi:MOSC domain-containing protein YiiM
VAKAAHLFRAVKRKLPMEEVHSIEAIAGRGLAGCKHGRPGSKRQVLLVDKETLDAMDLAPGIIRENITTEGLNVNGLALGSRLQVGEVVLEVSMVCTPCDQLELLRPGLRKEMWGRRGMLCRVVQGGVLRQGDAIQRVIATAAD